MLWKIYSEHLQDIVKNYCLKAGTDFKQTNHSLFLLTASIAKDQEKNNSAPHFGEKNSI